jgi:hypothetical protein
VRAIDALTGDRLLRLHVVGDAKTDAAARELGAAARRYSARGNAQRRGKKVWTYTHAWRAVARESWGDAVSVLASVETVREAREAMAKGYAAAVAVAALEREGVYPIGGTRVLSCPHQTRGVTCRGCVTAGGRGLAAHLPCLLRAGRPVRRIRPCGVCRW